MVDLTDLCLNFCFSILDNILKKMDDFPATLKAYLSKVISNTRDMVSEQLSLADMFVLSDFLF